MTHHTNAEREEFIQWANIRFYNGMDDINETWDEQSGRFLNAAHQMAWCLFREMKSKNAPAAPVPQGWSLHEAARDALEWLDDDDLSMTHNIRERLRKALATAPQPPEAEENPLQEQLDEALQSLGFYKRRCDLLQSIQQRMRDPERTMVCDVLANGHLLQGGDGQPDKARYAPPEAAPVQLPEYGIDTANHAGIRVRGYTEQQVRELLAAQASVSNGTLPSQPTFKTEDGEKAREPLTDEQWSNIWAEWFDSDQDAEDLIRSIERAHGIGVKE